MSFLARVLDKLCENYARQGMDVSEDMMIERLKDACPDCTDGFYFQIISKYRQETPEERRKRQEDYEFL
jgi:hypothetical protein